MPAPQFTKKGFWVIIIFCSERTIFTVMIGHRKSPDRSWKILKLSIAEVNLPAKIKRCF